MTNPDPFRASDGHIEKLRAHLQAKGVTRMHVDWAHGASDLTADERARELLAIQWEIDQGHACAVKLFGRPWGWTFDVGTWKRSFRIKWRDMPAWIGDRRRSLACRLRKLWNTHVLGRRNPYRARA